jgi:TolB-like protein
MLIADVQRLCDHPISPHRDTDLWDARAAKVIVFPFEHPADDPASIVMAQAIGTDLLAGLASSEDLRALPLTTHSAENGFRLCGEVRLAGPLFRVSIRLDSPEGAALFAERVELLSSGALELSQAEIERLTTTLIHRVNLEDLRRARITSDADRTARQLWLLGRDRYQRGTEADTEIAISLLERAIQLDPEFATPYAWLSYAVQRGFSHGWGALSPDEARHRALVLARRAVTLEPNSQLTLSRFAPEPR